MKTQKYILYVTDKDLHLYTEKAQEISRFLNFSKAVFSDLNQYITPADSVSLLINRGKKDLHEEDITGLSLWNFIGLFFHKKAGWANQGGYGNVRFMCDGGRKYIRWSHIESNDPLCSLISWVKERRGNIFFFPLEVYGFLSAMFHTLKLYRVCLYSLSSEKPRQQLVFKGGHLLLSRPLHSEEDVSSSLHFLSRTFPDIYENIEKTVLSFPQFLEFLGQRKKSLFPLRKAAFSKEGFLFWGTVGLFGVSLLGTIFEVYQGLGLYRNRPLLLASGKSLHTLVYHYRKNLDHSYKQPFLRALEAYLSLHPHRKNPVEDLKKMAPLLGESSLPLSSLKWEQGKDTHITFTFFLETLAHIKAFQALPSSLQKQFPKGEVRLVNPPPYQSPTETLRDLKDAFSGPSSVKLILP